MLWAVVIAIATWPVRVKVAQKTGLGDTGVAAIMTAAVAVLVFFPIIYSLILAASDLGALTHWVMEAQKSGIAVPDWLRMIPTFGDQAVKWWSTNLADPAGLSVFMGSADNVWIRSLRRNWASRPHTPDRLGIYNCHAVFSVQAR